MCRHFFNSAVIANSKMDYDKEQRKWPVNVTQTTAKIRLIRSVKVWNPPQLNLRIMDLRTNTNLRRLATRTIHEQIRRVISASFSITPSFHVNNIVKVVFYHLRNIAEIRKYMNVTTAEVLVNAFINSKLDFCNSLLHGLPKYEINKLHSVQNAAARDCLLT